MKRKLRMGMVGGGPGGFIGDIHRKAALMTGDVELVCGAFSSDPLKSKVMGKKLFLEENRIYDSYLQMIDMEAELEKKYRMDFLSIVTPNYLHYPMAKYALKKGFPVICDKPLTISLEQALELLTLSRDKNLPFGVTYVYSGYPLIREARKRLINGELGKIRKVLVIYTQGWLAESLQGERGDKIPWRLNPEKGGVAGCIGDIGSHAEHIVRYITGLHIKELYADLHIAVKRRRVYDDGDILLHFDNGATGVISVSQIASGEENNLIVKVYGEKGGVVWKQQKPNSLILMWNNSYMQILRSGLNSPGMKATSISAMNLPAGHPEGFIEAFANIYKGFACDVRKTILNENVECTDLCYPDVSDGVNGMAFIEGAVKSNMDREWVPIQSF